MSRVMTYLSKEEYARFREICEREQCTPYMLFKTAVLDHIWAYPLENAPASEEKGLKQDLEAVDITDSPEPETSKLEADEVSERVRKILEGKKE